MKRNKFRYEDETFWCFAWRYHPGGNTFMVPYICGYSREKAKEAAEKWLGYSWELAYKRGGRIVFCTATQAKPKQRKHAFRTH